MKANQSYEQVRGLFTQYLKENQHRKTPERYAILEHIYNYVGHFNAELLYNSMTENYRVSLATVYNTLDLMMAANLIVKHQLGGQFAQYEKNFGSNIHNHLICSNCGKVKEFSDKQIRTSIQTKTFSLFEVSHYSLYLFGLCSKCKELLHNENAKSL